ncbi:hypothetical protein GCM10007320_66670 [Pseudorhodoferax aquiterrae]|uniref:Uncharacterized protein n=1 Tax=Pseudorhodoferax aquiterrae TaxID=747304 RepID=A0ABQ3GID1_9BURK|nr:hypothetical protein [Pseudorhodoferax aquiterrae]GHD05091.1 hypothetical protein GCM10007320_66670 [Pseudorhodoferax aquiterrae]
MAMRLGLRKYLMVAGLSAALASEMGHAFQVLPRISDVDRKLTSVGTNQWVDGIGLWFVGNALPMLKNPVHEAITLNALDCTAAAGSEAQCLTRDAIQQHQVLLYGVRWPDDPPFALNRDKPPRTSSCNPAVALRSTAQPKCWATLFADAGTAAKANLAKDSSTPAFGPGEYILYRSHFGDLQFFHSMAAHDGEMAAVTQRRMKTWAQFLWGVATKTLPTDRFIRDMEPAALGEYFPGDITATNLLATGIVEVRKDLSQVAMGALLHMVQDSFSQAHSGRVAETGAMCPETSRFAQPGRIDRFYSYAGQLGSAHDREDTFSSLHMHTLQVSPTVVDASRNFLTLWKEGASWEEAEKLFDCVFALQAPGALAGPGPFVD